MNATVASLKEAPMIPPVLPLPRTEERFTLDTYVCDEQIECVLFQEQRAEVIALFATGPELSRTRNKNWPQSKESA